MQEVVQQGKDYVFASHVDQQDLTGLYGEVTFYPPEGGSPVVQPAADIVPTPYDFIYAYDELHRKMDPRRFAGEGGTPIGP